MLLPLRTHQTSVPTGVPTKLAVGLGALSLGIAATGTAYAVWAVSGSGAATAAAATISSLTVSAAVDDALYPGRVSGVTLTVANPNTFPVTVTGLTVGSVTSSNPTGCPASNVVLTPPGTMAMNVAAGSTANNSLASMATMLLTAPTACAGVTFSVAVSVSGVSA